MDSLDKILKCLNILLDVAAQSNRNIIIDQVSKIAQINSRKFEYIFVKYYQPNIYESTRRRKMKFFEKYKRRAVVLVPSNEVYNNCLANHNQFKNESFINLINDMKG